MIKLIQKPNGEYKFHTSAGEWLFTIFIGLFTVFAPAIAIWLAEKFLW